MLLGMSEGDELGSRLGSSEGDGLGKDEGDELGEDDGEALGLLVTKGVLGNTGQQHLSTCFLHF